MQFYTAMFFLVKHFFLTQAPGSGDWATTPYALTINK